jgi:hypothetical protein
MDAPTEAFLTMRHRAAKRTEPWYLATASPPPPPLIGFQLPRCLTSPPPQRSPSQDEDIPARKKPRLDPIIKSVAATTNDVIDTENFANGSNDATEPKILFSGEKVYALHSGDAFSPQQFELYGGAPCPICYEDLGVNVPKGTKFDIAVKTFKGNSKEQNSHLKTLGDTCRKHSSNVHNGLPIWCVYRKQELDKTKSRVPTKEATVPGLLHHALKAACQNIPFEMFCPAEKNITLAVIRDICLSRFSFAIGSLGAGAGNYLRERKSRIPKKVIRLRNKLWPSCTTS